jgi:2-polyprenyl-3-methyl-5-hydroxy-6-metoxy-1,4-benzoquinol methylase
MANFQPFKHRFLMILRDNLRLFDIRGRFIDFGCGRGDVSSYLIDEMKMREGVGYDPSFTDAGAAERTDAAARPNLIFTNRLEAASPQADLAILFDVIEHVPNPDEVLRAIHDRVKPDGWMAVTLPYNPHEWGVDDDFYGHLRRLSKRGAIALMENNGWDVIRVLDPSFPTFWIIRKVYLWTRRFTQVDVNPAGAVAGSDMDRSLVSSRQSAWDTGGVLPRLLSGGLVPWNFVRHVDLYFESIFWGFELFVLCQKREGDRRCEVCHNGVYTHGRFFQKHALQQCTYCASEKLSPRRPEPGYYNVEAKALPRWLERLVSWCRRGRIRLIASYRPPDQSLLVVRCGRGLLPAHFKQLGWRTTGAILSDRRGKDELLPDVEFVTELSELPPAARYGVITLFHVIEHVRDIDALLRRVDALLLPGGYLLLEYPNSESLLKRLFKWRWLGYDPPYHRLIVNPRILTDDLGLRNYRLVKERHFSIEYSFFIFAQTLANALLPFQRDALYRLVRGQHLGGGAFAAALFSVPVFALALPLFVGYQLVAGLLRRGCVVQQVFRKTDIEA